MRSREYRVLRRAGLMACRFNRKRLSECDRALAMGLNMHDTCKWLVYRDDWARRLHAERVLLRELRRPNGEHLWRLAVIAMRPKGSVALLVDAGLTADSPRVSS